MPPKRNPPDQRSTKHKFGIFGDKNAKNSASKSTSGRATPSASNAQSAIRNARLAIDGLKAASDISHVLGPLKLVCFALKLIVDTTEGVVQNNEDIRKLLEKLKDQLEFVQDKMNSLAGPRFRPSGTAVQGLVKSLQKYTSELEALEEKLESLDHQDKSRTKQVWKKIWSVHSDRGEIDACGTRLEGAFQLFMHSVTFFIADQTSEILARQALDRLPFVEGAQGNQHLPCLEGTRKNVLEEITKWASDGTSEPVFCIADQAGTGKSTISAHMTRKWRLERNTVARYFFSKPMAIASGEGVASTLAADMAVHVPLLRSMIVKVLDEHPHISSEMIGRKLEILIVTPLKRWKEDRVKALRSVRTEILERKHMEDPGWNREAEQMLSRRNAEEAKSAYLAALNEVNNEREDSASLETLESAYSAYLEALVEALVAQPIIVVDALDECAEGDRDKTLRYILDAAIADPALFKLLLTCRPEEDITDLINNRKYTSIIRRSQLSLHSKDVSSNQEDISLYVDDRLSDTLDASQRALLSKHAQGLFIWASTAADFILKRGDRIMRFESLLAASIPNHPLDSLYSRIIECAFASVGEDQKDLLEKILQVICVAREPLTIDAMDELLGMRRTVSHSVSGSLMASLRSVLSDGNNGKAVQILHPTFLEYLLREKPKEGVFVLKSDAELLAARGCLATLLTDQLKYDICEVTRPSEFVPLNREINDLQQLVQTKVSPALRYAAVHGLSHMSESLQDADIVERLQQFYETKLPYWIELMSFLGKVYPLITSVHNIKGRIEEAMKNTNALSMTEAREWSGETLKLMRSFQATIEESAMQVYSSAIAFAPPISRIFRHYHGLVPIPRVLRGAWSAHSQSIVLGGHKNIISCLAFSPDGRRIASGSFDHTVRLWDVQAGAAVGAPLVGHSRDITCLTFSPDGQGIASAASDGIRLWDTVAGTAVIIFLHIKDQATCLSFSLNGQLLYSGSSNRIQVWDAKGGAAVCEHTFQHSDVVKCLSFSPDGLRVATASPDNTIQLWNTETGAAVGTPLVGHTSSILCLSFSLDGRMIVSASEDNTIRLWNTETGSAVGDPLLGHTHSIKCLSFSPNGQILASGSYDSTIRLWSAKTGAEVGKPLNRRTWVRCLSFSPDGKIIASGGEDDVIQLLESGTGVAMDKQLEEHISVVLSLSFSPDGQKVVSGSDDKTIRVWDAETGSSIGVPFQCDHRPQTMQLHLLNSELLLLVNNSKVYNLSSDPPILCLPNELPEPETAISPIEYEAPWTYVKGTTITRFRLPSTFSCFTFSIHEGKIAYGGWDGTVIIVDCTHLL